MNKRNKLVLAVVALIIGSILYSFISPYITLAALKAHAGNLKTLALTYPVLAIALYLLGYLFFAFTPTPGEALLSILGGFIFGKFEGTMYALIGATLSAMGAFLFSRNLVGSYLKKRYNQQYLKIEGYFKEQGPFFILGLRLIPTMPSSFINYLAGMTPISLLNFAISTFIGIIPVTVLLVFAGQKLYTLESIGDILTPSWLLVLAGLTFLAFLSPIIKFLKNKGFLQ